MAIHKSAIKRERQNEKRYAHNAPVRSKLKAIRKKVLRAANKGEAEKNLRDAMKAYDKAAQKGVIPRENASRHISRLATFVGQMN